MMTYRTETGKLGEDRACEYLVDKKFKIIERNYRKSWGELDIIALAPDRTLVFIEVKTLRQTQSGPAKGLQPEDQMTAAKIKKFKRTASLFAGSHPELIDDNKGWRLDVIALVVNAVEPLTKVEKNFVIRHYENIV
jgi:putative endonuclease